MSEQTFSSNSLLTISLVIPAYNEEKYIGECLDNIFKHASGKFKEIIVVDNNSTDKTAEIARSYPGVQVLLETHKGVTRARQCGVEKATGDIIAFIDADCHISPDWYPMMIHEFTTHPHLACLSGPYIYYDIPIWQQYIVHAYWLLLGFPISFFTGYMAMGGNLVIRRNILQKMGGLDTTIEFYGDDTDTARRASAFGLSKFKARFIMYSSGRRLKKQGFVSTTSAYVLNYTSEMIIKKPVTKKYKDFR